MRVCVCVSCVCVLCVWCVFLGCVCVCVFVGNLLFGLAPPQDQGQGAFKARRLVFETCVCVCLTCVCVCCGSACAGVPCSCVRGRRFFIRSNANRGPPCVEASFFCEVCVSVARDTSGSSAWRCPLARESIFGLSVSQHVMSTSGFSLQGWQQCSSSSCSVADSAMSC